MARKKRAQEELAAEMKIEKKRIRDEVWFLLWLTVPIFINMQYYF